MGCGGVLGTQFWCQGVCQCDAHGLTSAGDFGFEQSHRGVVLTSRDSTLFHRIGINPHVCVELLH